MVGVCLGFGIWGLGFSLVGCGHPLRQVNLNAPLINSVYPPDGATEVELVPAITATFDKSMDPSTINTATFTLAAASGVISGSVTYNANSKTAHFSPSIILTANTKYTATISDQVKESGGNRLEAPYAWSFTTGGYFEARGITDESFSDGTRKGFGVYQKTGEFLGHTVYTPTEGGSMTMDLHNRILAAGGDGRSMLIWRILPDGLLDNSFGSNGTISWTATGEAFGRSIIVGPDGKIIVTGEWWAPSGVELMIWRYNSGGTTDEAFGSGGKVEYPGAGGSSIALDPAGNLIVLTAGGKMLGFEPDGTFNSALTSTPEGIVFRAENITADASGKKLETGRFSDNNSIRNMGTWRYNPDGTPDQSFGESGVVSFPGGDIYQDVTGKSVLVDPFGRILVMGRTYPVGYSSFQTVNEAAMTIWRYK